jgi:hypothetical protein
MTMTMARRDYCGVWGGLRTDIRTGPLAEGRQQLPADASPWPLTSERPLVRE